MEETRKSTALLFESPYDSLLLVSRMMAVVGFELVLIRPDESISKQLERLPKLELIVFDSNLIGFDGKSLAEDYYAQIKANPKTQHVPLIIIAHEKEKDSLKKLQADMHIIKPIDVDEFYKILRYYLAK